MSSGRTFIIIMPTTVPAESQDSRHVALTIGLAVLGVFVTYVPITAISVALTTIGASTGAGSAEIQWFSDAYVIPMAAAVLSAGVFGDIHGRRRVFILGMALTVLGALIAGLADAWGNASAIRMLMAGQVVSGLGAGMLLPTTLALIGQAVPNPRERGKFIGIWATGLMLGLALGPIMSGTILELASWGWIFAPTAVLATLAGTLAFLRLPESLRAEGRTLDWPGQTTATVAIAASIFGTIQGGEQGWGSAQSIGGFTIAAIAFIVFVIVELRSSSPLMDLKLFASPTFSATGFSAMVALFSIVGAMFLLSLFLGYVQQLSPLQIGVRLLFVTGIGALTNPVVGAILHRVDAMGALAVGLLVSTVGILTMTGIEAGTGLVDMAWRLAIFGVGVAVMMTAVSTAAINSVPWQLAGMAAATNTALRQYGGALGPAVLGVIFNNQVADGATPASSLHTALIVNAVLLGLAAIACAVVARAQTSSGRGAN